MRNAVVFAAAGLMLLAGCGEKTPLAAKKKGPSYRLAPIARTDVVRSVEATGTITPRNSIKYSIHQIRSDQSLNHVRLFATP